MMPIKGSAPAPATSYQKLNAFSTEDGLASNHVYDLVEDDKGFLWVATDNGVSRFDGKYFQHFSVKDGLPSNDVLQIVKEQNGTIWVNCYKQRPAYFDERTNRFISFEGISFLEELSASLLVFVNLPDGGIRCYNELGSVIFKDRKILSLERNKENRPNYLVVSNRDQMKIHLSLISRRNDTTFEVTSVLMQDNKAVRRFYSKRKDFYLYRIVNDNQLYEFGFKREFYRLSNFNKASDPITERVLFPEEMSWYKFSDKYLSVISKKGTVYVYEKKHLKLLYTIKTGVAVNCAYFDSNDNLWIGTLEDGLLYYGPQGVKKLDVPQDLINPHFLSIAVSKDGELYAGNHFGQVLHKKGIDLSVKSISQDHSAAWIRKIIFFDKHAFLIHDSGYVLDFKKHTVNLPDGLLYSLKTGMAFNDSTAIVGTINGLLSIDVNTQEVRRLNSTPDRSLSMVKFNDSIFYYLGSKGLYSYNFNKNSSQYISIGQKSSKEGLLCLTATADGLLWIATTSGNIIVLKDDKVLKKIAGDSRLPENATTMLAHKNRVWIGSKMGINIIEYSCSDVFNYTIQSISKYNGLPSSAINDMVMHNDTLYAATENGIALIQSDYKKKRSEIPTYVVGAKINHKSVPITHRFKLGDDERNVSLEFAGVALGGDFNNIQYALNDQKVWNNLKGNTLNLELNGGETVLYVRSVDVNNNAGRRKLKITFEVAIPFYSTVWFWTLMAFLFSGLLFRFYNQRKLSRQKIAFDQQILLEKQRGKITADLHDEIGASLSSLQINSAVANQLLDKDPLQARKMLQKIESQSKNLADKIGDIIWSMKPGKDEFMTMTSRINNFVNDILGATDIRYELDISKEINSGINDIGMRKNIILIIKEAVNNALKYSKATKLVISLKIEDNKVWLVVADNGVGFDPHQISGNGVTNMRRRTEELNGRFMLLSEPGKGTSVQATVPLIP